MRTTDTTPQNRRLHGKVEGYKISKSSSSSSRGPSVHKVLQPMGWDMRGEGATSGDKTKLIFIFFSKTGREAPSHTQPQKQVKRRPRTKKSVRSPQQFHSITFNNQKERGCRRTSTTSSKHRFRPRAAPTLHYKPLHAASALAYYRLTSSLPPIAF